MNIIRRYVAFVFVFSLILLSLSGCAGETDPDNKDQKASSEEEKDYGEYTQVYRCFKNYTAAMDAEASTYGLAKGENSVTSMEDTDTGADYPSDPSYSGTNLRDKGVDEADIVKTDGEYIYTMLENNYEIAIVDTKGDLRDIGRITVEDDKFIREFFVDRENNRLIVICDYYENEYTDAFSLALTFDISDFSNIKELGRVRQTGNYQSSRMKDGFLYLFTEYYVDTGIIEPREAKTFVPLVGNELLPAEKIILPITNQACRYTIVSSVGMDAPDKVKDSRGILSEYGQIYTSMDSIFYYTTEWESNNYTDWIFDGEVSRKTTLRKIGYSKGEFGNSCSAVVDGYLNDSFSIDEYEGYVRMVLSNEEANNLIILDKELKQVGSITDLAPGERVYSARFLGDMGYFVTYKETDPVFAADLSDPAEPVILGELKIPGFSEYLHPFGKDKLLGIGMNVDSAGVLDGVKAELFDISDPSNLSSLEECIVPGMYGADASYDYKAVMIAPERGLIGFSGSGVSGDVYVLLKYENDRIVAMLLEEVNGSGRGTRGIYIGDVLYVVNGNIIEAYSLADYSKVDDLIL